MLARGKLIVCLTLVGLLCPSVVATASGVAAAMVVARVTIDGQRNPLGIDSATPRLSWQLTSPTRNQRQTAYRVRVGGWDSGKVASSQSVQVPYGGPALRSRTRYPVAVQVWDRDGRASAWSAPTWFETGLRQPDDWSAQWIAHDGRLPLPEANGQQNYPAELTPGHTLGQTFEADRAFDSVGGGFPTWHTSDSDITVSLYRGGPGGELVASKRFVDHPDNAYAELTFAPLSPGVYYLEQSEVAGKAGWWSHTGDVYPHGTAFADGVAVAGDRTIRWRPAPGSSDERTAQLRRDFTLGKQVASARVYATALGVYELELNGKRVGNDRLAPGWTDYRQRVQYQTYDVTRLVGKGDNAIGARLAPGWYAGKIAMYGPNLYGTRPGLLAQLEVTYTDGTTQRVVTDTSWRSANGPFRTADPLDGESYDARLETPGWSKPGFAAAQWKPVLRKDDVTATLVAQADPPVQVTQDLPARAVTEPAPGMFVFDLGQNMVGAIRLAVRGGVAGERIRLRYGEVLSPDGTLYTDNLRGAQATDYYTRKGGGHETFEPRFTFHGFRYVEVTGYPGKPPLSAVTGRVVGTNAPMTGRFSSSSEMLNQLQRNIVWSQRGNFLSIPTDCPQRDERMGWTGDINVFAPTAAFNMDTSRFLGVKWLRDLRDAQGGDGAFPDVAPFVPIVGGGTAGWGDAGITVPYTMWQVYGDTGVIEENYAAMAKWLDYLTANSTGLIRPDAGYGDWLNVEDPTPRDLVGTAYFAHAARLMAEMAAAVGRTADAARYRQLFADIVAAFQARYVAADGTVAGDSQTGYVLALSFRLLPDELRAEAAAHLVRRIEERGWHLSTGFLGTPELLSALSDTGHTDVAYRLLNQRTFPSWGYEIEKGATTVWERWDSIKPDGGFQDPAMNSFNHYAYGAVGEWLYGNVAGINVDPSRPGYQHIVIRPRPGGELTHASGSLDSVYGTIESAWRLHNGRFTLTVTVPVNTTATIHVPAGDVTESGQPVRTEGGVIEVGSGTYRFAVG